MVGRGTRCRERLRLPGGGRPGADGPKGKELVMMATYKAKLTWKKNPKPMNYLVAGDKIIIRKQVLTVKESFTWDGKLVYSTDKGLLYADELQRLD